MREAVQEQNVVDDNHLLFKCVLNGLKFKRTGLEDLTIFVVVDKDTEQMCNTTNK